jgi:hypothetical protein
MGGGDSRPPSNSGTIHAQTETWNGSAWTEVNDLNTARGGLGGSGTLTDGIVYGGQTPPSLTNTEAWDGTSWTEVNDLATARARLAETSQSGTSALGFGGEIPPGGVTTATEEWQFSGLPPSTPAAAYADAIIGDFYYNSTTGQFKTVNTGGAPVGTWSSGGEGNTGREGPGSNGTQTSNLVYGGSPSPPSGYANTESYDGTSFTEVSDLNQGRYQLGGAGVSNTSAVGFGGYVSGGATNTETWNGSSWTEVNEMNTGRYGITGTGIITSAIGVAGYTTTILNNVETWDGTNWTEVAEINNTRYVIGSTGHDNEAVIIFGGAAPSKSNAVEQWNGSSWTEVSEINTARNKPSGSGTESLALAYGGVSPSPGATTKTEAWDGTSWTEVNDLATGRAGGGGSNNGTSSAALFSLGNREPGLSPSPTEEFTAADFAIKTVTTS